MNMDGDDPDEGGPAFRVRSYVITQGRTRSAVDLPLETLVKVTPQGVSATPRLALERKKIVSLCNAPISIAEIWWNPAESARTRSTVWFEPSATMISLRPTRSPNRNRCETAS